MSDRIEASANGFSAEAIKMYLQQILEALDFLHSRDVSKMPLLIAYTGWPRNLYALTSSNIDRFSNLFHYQNQENICKNIVNNDPTTPQICRYPTL